MVRLHVKKADQSLFLYDTNCSVKIDDLLKDLVAIHNGRLKIERLCFEIDEMSKHGVSLPPQMQGLSSEQIKELKLEDSWRVKQLSSSDYILNSDSIGKRNGFAPTKRYAEILTKTTAEAKTRISQKLVESGVCLSLEGIKDTLEILEGAVMIVYPMGLPPYEIIQQELEGKEDLTGTQASKEVLIDNKAEIWWANKNLDKDKILSDYVGKNEKSKLVVKLQKQGHGAPGREPILTEQQKKDLMLAEFQRKEEFKRLEIDDDDSHLDSQWADNNALKKNFLGMNKIRFK
ncbi:cilia- and flagella-associated protein 298-A-like [Parasteatoda tepidariorum]|uniref:cilia- and flagella-associated protein 298-A-like n=1 Tax=Parasteatoda tepidariorum TaxID=114398 RepID=UPI0039BD7C3A